MLVRMHPPKKDFHFVKSGMALDEANARLLRWEEDGKDATDWKAHKWTTDSQGASHLRGGKPLIAFASAGLDA